MIGFNITRFFDTFQKLIKYIPPTLMILLFSLLFAFILTPLLVWMKLGKNRILRKFSNGFTTVMRCTPVLVMLFLVYYGLPKLFSVFGIDLNKLSRFVFVVITFSILYAGLFSEIARSAYEAIPHGQEGAALSVGLSKSCTIRRIIFPQALVIAIPNLGNAIIALLKNSSLAFTIGFMELMGGTEQILALRFGTFPLEAYTALALIYWGICILLERVFKWCEEITERKMKRSYLS